MPRPTASRMPVTMNGSARRQHDVAPELPLRAAERAADLEQLRIDRLHALIGVDHHREEREQEQDDHLGGGLVAGPQHDQRHQRDRRDRVEERDVDGQPDVEDVEARQHQAEQRAERRSPASAPSASTSRLGHSEAHSSPLADHVDRGDRDLGGRGEQHRIDVHRRDLPERQEDRERDQADDEIVQRRAAAALGRDALGARPVVASS